MSEFLFQYRPVAPTTWVFLSSFLMIGLFFKFNRFWSVRNFDLLLLILLAPGMLYVYYGYVLQRRDPIAIAEQTTERVETVTDGVEEPTATEVDEETDGVVIDPSAVFKQRGFVWLLAAELLLLIRLLIDPSLTRRPLLAPNLTVGGMSFMGLALFLFLMTNVISSGPQLGAPANDSAEFTRMDQLIEYFGDRGPGYVVLSQLPLSANRTMAVVAHAAIILGIVLIGVWHFDNLTNGIGAAMLYLMLPYTTQMTGRIDHFIPAALLVWAILCYRRPLLAGFFLGAAAGCIYYPLFLLPLWLAFYQQRGWITFLAGVLLALLLLAIPVFFSPSASGVWSDLQRMFGLLYPERENLQGVWNEVGGFEPVYRLPVMATFAALSCSMALWPAHKNLASLISCSAAIMLAAQFWHGWGGGLFMAWFLPLTLLTIFRPNLEDRVAATMVYPFWSFWPFRRATA